MKRKHIIWGMKILYFGAFPACINVVFFTQQSVPIKVICGVLSVLIIIILLLISYYMGKSRRKSQITFWQYIKFLLADSDATRKGDTKKEKEYTETGEHV